MTENLDPAPSKLDQLISSYILASEEGTAKSLDTLCDENPEHATDIRAFFQTTRRVVTTFASEDAAKAIRIDGYEILREIGRGGMGVVFEAHQSSLDRKVAIKVLRDGALSSAAMRARFDKEAQLVAQMKHASIVDVLDFGRVDSRPFFVMPLLDGQPLSRAVRDKKPLPEQEAAGIMVQVADAIHYAHSLGVIHRDIKPGNIIGDQSKYRVADFGLAMREESDEPLTATGDVIGTPGYLAPEIIRGQSRGDVATDVYSTGATLYTLVTGQAPHHASSGAESMMLAMQGEPVPPQRLNAALSTDISSIAMKCLASDPARRYASAADLRTDLQSFLDGKPVSARPPGAIEKVSRWCQRHPAATGVVLLSTALLSLLAIGIPFVILQQRDKQQAEELATANASLAATQEYYARTSDIRDWIQEREPGWTWQSLEALRDVARLNAEGKDPIRLRSMIAQSLAGIDIRLAGTFAHDISTYYHSVSPNGRYVAGCSATGSMNLYRLHRDSGTVSGELIREFGIPDEVSGKGVLERMALMANRQLVGGNKFYGTAFSHDGRYLAAGTRKGELYEWDLSETDSPAKQLIGERGPRFEIVRLHYSPNDRFLIGLTDEAGSALVWDREVGKLKWSSSLPVRDAVTHAGRTIISTVTGLETLDLATNPLAPTPLEHSNFRFGVFAGTDDGSGLAWFKTHRMMGMADAKTGKPVFTFPEIALRRDPGFLEVSLGPDDLVAVTGDENSTVTLFDTVSGKRHLSIRSPDTNSLRPNVDKQHAEILLKAAKEIAVYRLRSPRGFGKALSDATTVINTFAPSAWPILSFDINESSNRILIMEQEGSDFRRQRVRTFDMDSMQQKTCTWFTSLNREYDHRTHGADVAAGTENAVLVASRALGLNCELRDDEIRAFKGLVAPYCSARPRMVDGRVQFELPTPFRVNSDHSYYSVALTWRVRGGGNFEAVAGTGTSKDIQWTDSLTEELNRAQNDEWHCVQVRVRKRKQVPGKLIYVVDGLPTDLVTTDAAAFKEAEEAVQFGSAFLVAARGPQRSRYAFGPIKQLASGSVVSMDSSSFVKKWDAIGEKPVFQWVDLINTSDALTGIAAGDKLAAICNVRGQVLKITPDNKIIQITPGARLDRDRRSGRTATALAMSRDDRYAVSGNRDGELLLFDLSRDENFQVSREKHFRDRISALAMSDNGSVVAGCDFFGRLSLFRREGRKLQPLFNLELDNPVTKMRFSTIGDRLFMLCRDERGVRVLQLGELAAAFESYGLSYD